MSSTVLGRWFPAAVRLPDSKILRNVYVLLAAGEREGLHIWSKPGEVAELRLPADVGAVRVPRTDRDAKHGFDVPLIDGTLAVVTKLGSCGCGSPLRRWAGPQTWGLVSTVHA